MGRKSRRNMKDTAPAIQIGQEIIPTAIYARLSVENSGKDDSGAAIANQIEICKEYIEECAELQLVKVYEDNGWTGTVMRRPAFDELMEDVRKGIIRAIVVRDLSRFGRNYIETGTYLEKIFPKLDVRFISVKERFDTFTVDQSNESLMVPLQNLINDLYSKDISRKVEAALHVQMEEGRFAWRHIPYGYCWDKDHKNIIPDETTAPVVRDIFQMSAEGISGTKIAESLDGLQIPPPSSKGGKTQKSWSWPTIYGILRNPAYIGKRVYGRKHSAIYKGIKWEKVPEENWYVIENAHEPLVTEEIYNKIKDKREQNARRRKACMERTAQERGKLENYFENRIFCADCGYKMNLYKYKMDTKGRRWNARYYCNSNRIRKHLGCSCHRISQKSLHEEVVSALRTQIEVALDYEEVIRKYRDSKTDKDVQKCMDSKIRDISRKISEMQVKKIRLYEDLSEKNLTKEEYSFAKENYEKDYEMLSRQFDSLVQERAEYREMISPENKWIRMIKNIPDVSKLSQALVDTVIERVLVFEGGDIEIIMKYQDVFEITRDYIREIKETSERLSENSDEWNVSELQRKGEVVDGENENRHIHPTVNG